MARRAACGDPAEGGIPHQGDVAAPNAGDGLQQQPRQHLQLQQPAAATSRRRHCPPAHRHHRPTLDAHFLREVLALALPWLSASDMPIKTPLTSAV